MIGCVLLVGWSLVAVRCLLRVDCWCCLWFVVVCGVVVVCSMLFVVCCSLLFEVCWLLLYVW